MHSPTISSAPSSLPPFSALTPAYYHSTHTHLSLLTHSLCTLTASWGGLPKKNNITPVCSRVAKWLKRLCFGQPTYIYPSLRQELQVHKYFLIISLVELNLNGWSQRTAIFWSTSWLTERKKKGTLVKIYIKTKWPFFIYSWLWHAGSLYQLERLEPAYQLD